MSTRPTPAGLRRWLGCVLDGRFVIQAYLAQGASGVVFVAEDNQLDQPVAVKILSGRSGRLPNVAERFRAEVRVLAKLKDPHVLRPLSFGWAPTGEPYFVSEFLSGKSLDEEIRDGGPLEATRVVRLLIDVCSALAEAHSVGIVHRDIKPSNIFIQALQSGHETARLLDFGLAKFRSGEGPAKTEPGLLLGTPAFIAPEQAEGGAIDGRADLYGLGAVAYAALTGKLPFEGSAMAIVMAKLREPPPKLTDQAPGVFVDPALERIVLQLLSRAPKRRPPSAVELRARLESWLAAMVMAGPEPEPTTLDAPSDTVTVLASSEATRLLGGPLTQTAEITQPEVTQPEVTHPEATRPSAPRPESTGPGSAPSSAPRLMSPNVKPHKAAALLGVVVLALAAVLVLNRTPKPRPSPYRQTDPSLAEPARTSPAENPASEDPSPRPTSIAVSPQGAKTAAGTSPKDVSAAPRSSMDGPSAGALKPRPQARPRSPTHPRGPVTAPDDKKPLRGARENHPARRRRQAKPFLEEGEDSKAVAEITERKTHTGAEASPTLERTPENESCPLTDDPKARRQAVAKLRERARKDPAEAFTKCLDALELRSSARAERWQDICRRCLRLRRSS